MLSNYISIADKIITDISNITKNTEVKIKPLIQSLAQTVADGLKEKDPQMVKLAEEVVSKGRYSKDPTSLKNVSKIVKFLKTKHFPSVSDKWIENSIPDEYKETRTQQEREGELTNLISDRDLLDHSAEIIKRIKQIQHHGPSTEPKFKKSIEGIKKHEFNMEFSNILADIILNLEREYEEKFENKEKDPEAFEDLKRADKELTRRGRTISDKRNATSEAKYEAILLAASTFDSLNNATKYETEILTRWELFDREKTCRKCFNDLTDCRLSKCNCACHEPVKRLTTKGLKWAKEHNPHLQKLDKHIERISEWSDDICAFGKILLRNPHVDDYMDSKKKREILANHIEKDKCEQCEFFLEDHPNFFENV